MKHVKLADLDVSRIGLGTMGMSFAYTGAGSDDAESIRTIQRAARPRRHLHRHRRDLRPVHQRRARRPRAQGTPRPGRHRHEVRLRVPCGWRHRSARQHPGQHPRSQSKGRCDVSAPTTSTSTTSTASTRTRRSKRPSARWPNSSPKARSATSACPKRGRPRSAEHTPFTRSRRSNPSTPCGPAIPRTVSSMCCASSGIGFVPYSPLGHGFLTGAVRSLDELDDSDWRKTNPRFMGDNFQTNLRIADEVAAIARRGRRHPCAGRARMAARPGRRHRPDPWHEAGRTSRGERRGRRSSSAQHSSRRSTS